MACSQGTVAGWENCAGVPEGLLAYPGFGSPLFADSQYHIVALRNDPTGNPAKFAISCEANLRARGLIYMKKTPGDCGSSLVKSGVGSGQIVGLSGTAASGVIGGLGAAGAISGVATLGIGTAISMAVAGIEAVFAHHAQAVANEQSTICAVANYFNPLMQQVDRAVISGSISPDQGIAYIKQICQQAINGLQTIYKKCNAACYFIGYLKAHADLVSSLYPAISPAPTMGAQAPGAAPSTYYNTPGGVTDAGSMPPIRSLPNNTYLPTSNSPAPPLTSNKLLPSGNMASTVDYLNAGYNQQTGQSAQAADVPTALISLPTILLAALIAILLLVFA
jgi:hypothetical protein